MARKKRQRTPVKAIRKQHAPAKDSLEIPAEGIRLNRYIAKAGVCARRKADELIAAGRVKVNDQVVTELGTRVMPGDRVKVDDRYIEPQAYTYILLNKPADTITTLQDERGRRTVMDLIDDESLKEAGLFPVGRLDRNTVGVLLLTNDGELAHRLMHPRYHVEKLYHVRTERPVKPHELEQMRKGIPLEDGIARADDVMYLSEDHREIGIVLHEGRNRQIRRMLEALGHQVKHLERVNYAGLTTEGVRRGKWRRLYPHEIKRLKNRLKLR